MISATLIRNRNTLSLNSQSHFLFPCLRVHASGQGAEEAELSRTCPYDLYTGYSSLCICDLSGVLSAAL